MQLYLSKHGRHVRSILLKAVGKAVTLGKLQPTAKLHTLSLHRLHLQLQRPPGAHLTSLELHRCALLDGQHGLRAALSLLPALQHLTVRHLEAAGSNGALLQFPGDVLAGLPQLRVLQIYGMRVGGLQATAEASPLQHLTAMKHLEELNLGLLGAYSISASMLAACCSLTRLQLTSSDDKSADDVYFEPSALTGKTQLRHLCLDPCRLTDRSVGPLLSEFEQQPQLTFLHVRFSAGSLDGSPPATAFSSLTASSKLQRLSIRMSHLPAGVWQHVFPAGRQLPHLQSLRLAARHQATAPDGAQLISACPGLAELHLSGLLCTELLAQLRGHSGLTAVSVSPADREVLACVPLLTQLRSLIAKAPSIMDRHLLKLTSLWQLTHLCIRSQHNGQYTSLTLRDQDAPLGEPVRVQLLLHLIRHGSTTELRKAALKSLYMQHLQDSPEGSYATPASPEGIYIGGVPPV